MHTIYEELSDTSKKYLLGGAWSTGEEANIKVMAFNNNNEKYLL